MIPEYLTATPTDPVDTGATFSIRTENTSSDWCGSYPSTSSQAENGNVYIYIVYTYPHKIPTKLFSKYLTGFPVIFLMETALKALYLVWTKLFNLTKD